MDIKVIIVLLCCALVIRLLNMYLDYKRNALQKRRDEALKEKSVLVKDLADVKKANMALTELVLSRVNSGHEPHS